MDSRIRFKYHLGRYITFKYTYFPHERIFSEIYPKIAYNTEASCKTSRHSNYHNWEHPHYWITLVYTKLIHINYCMSKYASFYYVAAKLGTDRKPCMITVTCISSSSGKRIYLQLAI